MRRVVFLASIAAMAWGCDKRPEGQTVAIVNGEEITSAEVNAELRGSPAFTLFEPEDARSRVIEGIIDRKLLVQQAKADEIDKSPEYLNQQRRLTENLLIQMLISRQLDTSSVPSAEEIRQFQESHPGMFAKREVWTLDQLQFVTPKDPAVVARINASSSLDEVAQQLSASGVQYSRHRREVDSSVFPPDMYNRIAGLEEGKPFVVPAGEQSVVSVIVARQAVPRTGEEARNAALAGIRQMRSEKIQQDRAKAARSSAKIEYQPGFQPKKGN